MTKWIARNIDELELKTIFTLIDLYPNSKLISVVSVGDNYTVMYDSLNKLSDESTVYVNERICI